MNSSREGMEQHEGEDLSNYAGNSAEVPLAIDRLLNFFDELSDTSSSDRESEISYSSDSEPEDGYIPFSARGSNLKNYLNVLLDHTAMFEPVQSAPVEMEYKLDNLLDLKWPQLRQHIHEHPPQPLAEFVNAVRYTKPIELARASAGASAEELNLPALLNNIQAHPSHDLDDASVARSLEVASQLRVYSTLSVEAFILGLQDKPTS